MIQWMFYILADNIYIGQMATQSPSLHPQSQSFDVLQKLIQSSNSSAQSPPPLTTQQSLLSIIELGILHIARQQYDKFSSISKQFSHSLMENKHIFIHSDILLENFSSIKFIICKHNKLYSLANTSKSKDKYKEREKQIKEREKQIKEREKQMKEREKQIKEKEEFKGFVVVGKAVSVYKRKKKEQQQVQYKEQRDELCQLIEQGVIRLFQDNKYYLPKHQKHYELNDILLHHDMPDSSIQQVYLSSQVYSPFVPIQKSIILVISSRNLKPECTNFVRSSLLHSYIDQIALVNKVISKEMFYKNSILKGLFFIEQGEVEVGSGRIIARGWTTYGKCKTSGYAWKFKCIPFIRFIIKNASIWKQFYNDITLNNQYPFNIIHILGLADDQNFTQSAQWRSLGKKKMGGKSPKLPKLNVNRSVDQSKLQQIEKLRHYDDKINDIFMYKQDLLTRKLKGIVHGKFQPIFRDQRSQQKMQKNKKFLMVRLNSKASVMSKRQLPLDTQPTQNILIMSVLKRLESIADMSETSTRRREYSISQGMKEPTYYKNKRQNVKILPMQIHQRTKQLKRSKRY